MRTETLRMEKVTYCKDGIRHLNNLELNVFAGEILGLIPLNSYGLAELLDVIRNNLPLQFGYVFYREKCVNNWHQSRPRYNPVGYIQSSSQLVNSLSLADNIFVLRRGFRAWYVKTETLRTQMLPFFSKIGVDIPPDTHPKNLSSFQRIVVELVRSMVAGYRLIIIHDIGTLLSTEEQSELHRILKRCTEEGFSFLYVGFHPEEIEKMSDRIAIFTNGRIIRTFSSPDSARDVLSTITSSAPKQDNPVCRESDTPVFRAENLSLGRAGVLSFSVYPGECVFIKDTLNCITEPMLNLLLGNSKPDSGELYLCERPFSGVSDRNIALVAESPTRSMLFPQLSYFDNLFFTCNHHLPDIWRNKQLQRRVSREYASRTGSELLDTPIEALSETSKYDLVYNRILLQKPKVVVCVRPFKGADIELREHIRGLLFQLLKKQIAVVILTMNGSEYTMPADRIIDVAVP